MIPSQLIRCLRPAAELLGVEVGDVSDGAAHEDARALLNALVEAFDLARPIADRARDSRSEHAEEVARLFGSGLRDPQVAAELGIPQATVRSIRRRLGLRGTALPKERSGWEARLRKWHAEGLSDPEIAERSGWTIRTIQQRRSQLRLPANGRRT